jgi:hypothetical protein
MKMEQTECSETSAYKIQTPGNYPEENIQHTEHGESLKSRIFHCVCQAHPIITLKPRTNFKLLCIYLFSDMLWVMIATDRLRDIPGVLGGGGLWEGWRPAIFPQ